MVAHKPGARAVLTPTKKTFRQFTSEDGIPDDEFNSNAHSLIGRTLYAGSVAGLVRLQLDNIPAENPEADTQFVHFYLSGKKLEAIENQETLSVPISEASTLNIAHTDKVFSLFFSALEYDTPLKIRYRYRLQPFDQSWQEVDASRRVATYTNLDSGSYKFEVQASVGQARWGKSRALDINIAASPFNTPLAYTLYAAVIFSILFYIGHLLFQRQQLRQNSFRQLQDKEQELSFALWGSGDEVWNIDLKTNVLIRRNKLPEAIYEDEQIWQGDEQQLQYIHPEDAERVAEGINACIRGEAETFQETYRMKSQSGGWFWVLDKGKITEKKDGKPTRLSGAIKDIDKLKQTEEQLEKTNADLEKRVKERTLVLQLTNKELTDTVEELKNTQGQLVEAEKMASLGSMVAGISHEINTPIGVSLTAISHMEESAAELFNKVESNSLSQENYLMFKEELSNGLELAIRNLSRASELIASFKQVSVDQSAEIIREFNLHALLTDTIRMMHPKLKGKSHQVNLNCDGSLAMNSYPGALSQVIINLINNAITHGFKDTENGQIDVLVSLENDQVIIAFEDNGCGIPAENLSNIFAPFFTTNRAQGNTGLGMHICYNLLTQKLKGNIKVESEVDKGTTFVISLPAHLDKNNTATS